jgi:hypothetical protein
VLRIHAAAAQHDAQPLARAALFRQRLREIGFLDDAEAEQDLADRAPARRRCRHAVEDGPGNGASEWPPATLAKNEIYGFRFDFDFDFS